MKKFIFGVIAGLLVGSAASVLVIWQAGLMDAEVEMVGVAIHDTIYKDTLTVKEPVKELAFYNEKWLRKLFETTDYNRWENYEDGYAIMYPSFMERKDLKNPDGRKIELEFHGILGRVCNVGVVLCSVKVIYQNLAEISFVVNYKYSFIFHSICVLLLYFNVSSYVVANLR